MRKILKYSFRASLLFLLIGSPQAQDLRTCGLRMAYDVSGISYLLSDADRSEFEFSLDMEVAKDIYPVIEFGTARMNHIAENYDFSVNGNYFRIGVDRNYLKKIKTNQYEMLYGGIRYSYSNFTHSASNITVEDPVWGDYTGGEILPSTVNAHWLELAAGIRGEVFKNFFIGWSVRYRLLLANSASDALPPYMIPGFGVVNEKITHIGFNYSIYYRIPIYKVDYAEREKKREERKKQKEEEGK